MLKYQDGDHMAFDVLYSRHKDKVYSYLTKRLHSQNEIDDLFQRVFVKLHKSRHLYKDKYEVLPWIYTVTKSEFLDFIKKNKIETIEFKEESFSNTEDESSNGFDLESEKQLSEKERSALKERYYSDKDFSEIAQILKTSESNTRKIISRGLKKLRAKYQGENNE
jgi:RNA polymerase sigma-70 factor (ECF subfamily)